MAEKILVDITGLTRYHENLKGLLETKQGVIEDLQTIRERAAAGADALGEAKSYVDGKVDGKFDAAGSAAAAQSAAEAYADGLASNYEAAGAAAQALADAKADAASLYQVKGDYEAAGAAAQALADAKADAASLYQVKGDYEAAGAAETALGEAKSYVDGKVDGKFDAAGAAAQALADAKADAASLYQVKGDYEVAGTAAGLNEAMDERVKALEAIDHEKLATDASAAAVATVLDGAPEKFDTLKEVAEWISATDSASSAADLVTRVAALEAIDHDAYVDADATVLASAKEYAEGLAVNYEAAGAAAQALADAKADAASLYQVKGDYEAAGAAAQALADAKADAASLYQVKGNYATVEQVNAKQDAISDLAAIREGAAAGATALQESDLVFAEDADIDALFA